MKNSSRRDFLKNALMSIAALPLIESLLGSSAKAAEVDKTKGMAKNLGYVSNAAADCAGGKCGPKFKDASQCSNCTFYVKKDDKWGQCKLIKPGEVASTGWCKSYSKKA